MMNKKYLVVTVVVSYLLMLFGGAALKPDYSQMSQYISELNATGSPFAHIVSWLGFIPFGLLAAALIFVVAPLAPVRGLSRIGYWLLLAEPIAYIGSVIVPCDMGCPTAGSMSQSAHNILGLITYLTTAVALVLLSTAPNIAVRYRLIWIGLACIWLILFALMVDESMAHLRGFFQRLAEGLIYSVLCLSAWKILNANHGSNLDAGKAGTG